jgi:hypothetical protein
MCSSWFRSNLRKTPKKEDHLIFTNFGLKKFVVTKTYKKENFDFERYNLMDSMEWGSVIFEVDLEEGSLKILKDTSLSIHTLIFWENDFSNFIKTA